MQVHLSLILPFPRVDVRPAEDALRTALQNGNVHESLVEEPAAA